MTTAPHALDGPVITRQREIHVTGRRVVATVIDGMVFGFVYYLVALAFGEIGQLGEPANWIADVPVLANIGYGLFVVAYYVLLEGYLGQTLGKMVTGIKVVSEATGQAPGLAAAAIRTALRIVDGLIDYLVGFLVVQSSDKRQRLGDKAAHTLVVRG
jgi:uncharacterized RDD family membrane protein YckC